jgi:putative tryptophan/tyrosine transport system substrate-binding protein
MRRREFIALLLAALPSLGRAERATAGKLRLVGVLDALREGDDAADHDAFRRQLDKLGWIASQNINIEYRWGAGSIDRVQAFAKELVKLNPDVLVGITTPATAALQAQTHTIPIVFAQVSDPVGSRLVESLASPGANITGFINIEASLSGKWLELMRAVAPQVMRVGFLFNPETAPQARYYLPTFQSAASSLAIEPIQAPVRSAAELETVITRLSQEGGLGIVVMPDTSMTIYRETIYLLAHRYRLPTIYGYRFYVGEGGLMSYGIDSAEMFRGAAAYVDRILRGAKPADLPVQLPTKFELVINLKTAKELGLTVPPSILSLADELIE